MHLCLFIQSSINLKEKFDKISDHWSPKVIAEMNDYQFKLAKVKNKFVWHQHDDTDETFIVIKGNLIIEFRDTKVNLGPGEMLVVKKGTEHRPIANEECEIMLIEPKGVLNTGNKRNEYTKDNDIWI